MTEVALRAVVFDVDGVLLQLTAAEEAAYVGAFERCFGIADVDRDWNAYRRRNDREIAAEILETRLGRPPTPEEVGRVLDDYLSCLAAGLSIGGIAPLPLPGANAVVRALAGRRELVLALATANLARAAELRLSRVELWPYFSCGGFAEDGADKAAILAAVMRHCRDRIGTDLSADRMLFIGDQPSDVAAARANGTRFLGIARDPVGRDRLRLAGAACISATLTLEAILRGGGTVEHPDPRSA